MWSTTYDRELIDIFTVQDEIAAAVVRQLRVALLGGKLPSQSATTNVEAYNLYLQARYLSGQHSLESMEKAVHLYERALAIDPAYAEAWAALAEVHATQADEAYTDVPAGIAAARRGG